MDRGAQMLTQVHVGSGVMPDSTEDKRELFFDRFMKSLGECAYRKCPMM